MKGYAAALFFYMAEIYPVARPIVRFPISDIYDGRAVAGAGYYTTQTKRQNWDYCPSGLHYWGSKLE